MLRDHFDLSNWMKFIVDVFISKPYTHDLKFRLYKEEEPDKYLYEGTLDSSMSFKLSTVSHRLI